VTLVKPSWGHELFLGPLSGKEFLSKDIGHGIKNAQDRERICLIFKTSCSLGIVLFLLDYISWYGLLTLSVSDSLMITKTWF
jgi:hypothetical protein